MGITIDIPRKNKNLPYVLFLVFFYPHARLHNYLSTYVHFVCVSRNQEINTIFRAISLLRNQTLLPTL